MLDGRRGLFSFLGGYALRHAQFTAPKGWRGPGRWVAAGMQLVLLVGILAGEASAQCYSVTPSTLSLTWSNIAVGTQSNGNSVVIKNTCNTPLTINSFSLSPIEFNLQDGYAPATLPVGGNISYIIKFAPDSVQTFTGQLSISINGASSPVVVTLTGKGIATNAMASVTPSALAFPNQPLGTTSAPQTVTITNTGSSGMTVNTISVDPPFAVSGFSQAVVLKPGKSLTLAVTFFGQAASSFTSALVFNINVLPPIAVTLMGSGAPSGNLAITNFPVFPSATQGAAYSAQMQPAGAQGNVTWSLATGSSLPAGLNLASNGLITGSVAPTVAVGNYPFTVQAMDSANNSTTAQLSLPVGPATAAMCNNISWSVAGTSEPLVPINDLGTGYYLGEEGGLYSDGSNTRPAGHDADGVALANSIQPLDGNGNPDPNGKVVLLSIGMSVAHTDFEGFINNANADPAKNSHLVVVNGAQNGAMALHWADLGSPFWSAVFDYFLPQSGVTANQVVAVWVEVTQTNFQGTFPQDMTGLHHYMVEMAQNLHTLFPNLALAYFNSRYYCGYQNGLAHPPNPEPYGYETGFAVKNLIQNQLNGDPGLNYNPNLGPVMAPWLSWGPYEWTNGLTPRSDGLVASCQDRRPDGNHPSLPAGREEDANQLLNFFKTDDTSAPWFLANSGAK